MKVKEYPNSDNSYRNGDSGFFRDSESSDLRKQSVSGSIRIQKRRGVAASVRNPNVSTGTPGMRRSRPETPLLKWRIMEKNGNNKEEEGDDDDKGSGIHRKTRREKVVMPLPARKLAAELWRLQIGKIEQPEIAQSPRMSIDTPRSHESNSRLLCNSAMEGATKWDPVSLTFCNENEDFSSITIDMKSELDQARARIHELECERRASKKKVEHFLKKMSEEKAAWRAREHEKVRVIIEDMKCDLGREKKSRHRLEALNSKLASELAEAKMAAKRHLQEYEKERKARELIEEVCDELAKEIGEDKAEVEEERKMLQMAEVWREERVQMKLVDARVALEEKYSLMNKLVSEMESFIRTKSVGADSKDADALIRVASSLRIDELANYKYDPPNPDDIFSIFEGNGKGGSGDVEEDESGWETASHVEECYSPEGKLWRSVSQNGESFKEISVDAVSARKSNASVGKGGAVAVWSPPDSGNSRGIKGCIEWPRGSHKGNPKFRFFEGKAEGQKVQQLRHVLKHRI